MKHPNVTLPILVTCLAGCILLMETGCVGLGGGDVQPALYYTLEPLPPVKSVPGPDLERIVVGMGRIDVPDYLNRKEIVVRTGRNELRYTANHLWAERPGDSLQRLLSLNIERQSENRIEVHPLPWPDHSHPDWVVELAIHAFEGRESPSPNLLLEVSWSIQLTADGTVLKRGIHQSSGLSWVAGDYSELAEGLSEGLADVSRMIGLDLLETQETYIK